MSQLDNTLRSRQLRADLLHRIENAPAHGFSLSAFMESNAVTFETVYKEILTLAHEGRIEATRTMQTIKTKRGSIDFPVYRASERVRREEMPESLTARGLDSDDEINRVGLEVYGMEVAI